MVKVFPQLFRETSVYWSPRRSVTRAQCLSVSVAGCLFEGCWLSFSECLSSAHWWDFFAVTAKTQELLLFTLGA